MLQPGENGGDGHLAIKYLGASAALFDKFGRL